VFRKPNNSSAAGACFSPRAIQFPEDRSNLAGQAPGAHLHARVTARWHQRTSETPSPASTILTTMPVVVASMSTRGVRPNAEGVEHVLAARRTLSNKITARRQMFKR